METTRRRMLQAVGTGALAFPLAGGVAWLTPQQARARAVSFQVLSPDQARVMAAVGEALLPGADEAGIAHYVDANLAAAPEQATLMIRYLDIPPPFGPIYQAGLDAIDAAARDETADGRGFSDLAPDEAAQMIARLAQGDVKPWSAPPFQGAFYFAWRADAVDATYGTIDGFSRLGIPYMPHIAPEQGW